MMMTMALSFDEFVSTLKSKLTADERANSVAYAVEKPIAAGTQLKFPGVSIDVPWEAYLAFIDREPMANWGHAARYVLVNNENAEVRSYETRLPPFGPESELHWCVVYKSPS
jgi:hypothetical protein